MFIVVWLNFLFFPLFWLDRLIHSKLFVRLFCDLFLLLKVIIICHFILLINLSIYCLILVPPNGTHWPQKQELMDWVNRCCRIGIDYCVVRQWIYANTHMMKPILLHLCLFSSYQINIFSCMRTFFCFYFHSNCMQLYSHSPSMFKACTDEIIAIPNILTKNNLKHKHI